MYALLLAALAAFLVLLPGPTRAQQGSPTEPASGWLLVRPHQRIYAVPPSWQTSYARTDSLSLISYRSPDQETLLWVAAVRPVAGTAHAASPALRQLLRHVGVYGFAPTYTTERGLDRLESTGTCWQAGRELRYEVRVLGDESHHLLVFFYLTPTHTALTEPTLPALLRQLTPPALHR
ncbi:hypothetical protein [Hymenobacter weizhouensis]|uniref:hypothetical protein n=1 Tax=Hymenobacter sp. YIM 151500-1 TaxID=2987689 RepID=UPI002225F9A0|nr:hypothetical protein [Hymenobacter sp. YIM 151500-1]UYZ62772.1 hypothetical protein OIS53_17465 [Hymenobacter sp. YIM 151500-1]